LYTAWRLHVHYVAALGRALECQRLGSEAFLARDEASLALLRRGLFSPKLSYSLYCLQWLDRERDRHLEEDIPRLLDHPHAAMRSATASVVERRQLVASWEAVQTRLAVEKDPKVQGCLLRALAAVGEADAMETITPYVRDPNPQVQCDALVAMLKHCGIEGIIVAGADLLQAAASAHPEHRRMAAKVVEEVADSHLYRILLRLLNDPDLSVRHAALEAATRLASVPRLQKAALVHPQNRDTTRKAEVLLVAAGPGVVPDLEHLLTADQSPDWVKMRVIAILGQMPVAASWSILETFLATATPDLRHATLRALRLLQHRVPMERQPDWVTLLLHEVRQFTEWLAIGIDLEQAGSMQMARDGIQLEMERIQERIFILLAFSYPQAALQDVWMQFASGKPDKRAYAIEIIDNILPQTLKGPVIPVLEEKLPIERLQSLATFHPQHCLGLTARLPTLKESPLLRDKPWIRASLVYGAATLGGEVFFQLAATTHLDAHPVLRETAARVALNWPAPHACQILSTLIADSDPRVANMARRMLVQVESAAGTSGAASGRIPMSTIEKIIFLKQISLFSSIPEEYLMDIANRMEEGESLPGEAIVLQGEWGNALYIIGSGQVRVIVNGNEVAVMHEGDVFGELALLDPEPRSATVAAVGDVRHYRIDGQVFDEIMAIEPSVARNIIRMLCRRLRELHQRVTQKEPKS
ncbi:MAG: cyclic nucleotide-binding domain-containing protein, partial [Magnetococcales bacterium]|nr:cyclic nucleotide-binding domain-containing protein [Magnetococcales bacterium]